MFRKRSFSVIALSLMTGLSAWTNAYGESESGEAVAEPVSVSETVSDSEVAENPDGRIYRLNEVIVTPTRRAEAMIDTPNFTDSVSEREILDKGHRTVPESLREVPGVHVQKTSPGQGSPFIRGFTGFRNLMLIDGIRLNNSIFRDGPVQYWNTIDPYSIRSIEIVQGVAGSQYGSDAIGGVAQVFTVSPLTYGEGFNYQFDSTIRLSTAESSFVGRQQVMATVDQTFGIVAGLTYSDFGDIDAGGSLGRQRVSGYDQLAGDIKMEYYIAPNAWLTAVYQNFDQNDVPRTHSLNTADSWKGTTVGSDIRRDLSQERELAYLQFRAEELDGFINAMHASISYHRQFDTQDRIVSSGERRFAGREAQTLGLWAQFESNTAIGDLTYGVEWYRDYVDSFEWRQRPAEARRDFIQGPVGDDSMYDLVSAFVQNQIPITDRIELTLGGRYTYAAAESDRVADPAEDPVTSDPIQLDDSWDQFTGSARVLVRAIPDRLHFFGGISQGFRAPNLSDMTSSISSSTNSFEIPSLGLDAEDFLQYEIGFKAGQENWSLQFAYFYTDFQDGIIRIPTGDLTPGGEQIVTRRNANDGHIQGITLGGSWVFLPGWTLFGGGSWLDGQETAFADPSDPSSKFTDSFSRLPPVQGFLGVRWDSPNPNLPLWAEVVIQAADRQDRLSQRDEGDTQRIPPGGTPGYVVAHLRGGYQINDQVRFGLALENITDEDYRFHGSGTNEPGINLIATLEITW